MATIYMLLVVSTMQPASWTLPAAYWSMADCEAAKKARGLERNPEAICIAFHSDQWQ